MSVPTIRGVSFPVGTRGPALAAGRSGQARCGHQPRQRLVALALVTAVVVVDQALKWWAWRHVAGAKINSGGDVLVGHTISAWYGAPVAGALLDLLDVGLLSAALFVLVRRRRPAAVVAFGALMLGGWGSNLLDRLGMHYWTAPGSVRGVIDFIRIAGPSYNVADLLIIGATPLFLLAVGFLRLAATDRPAMVRAAVVRHRLRAPMLALAGAALVVLAVALGAANYGGVKAAPAHVSAKGDGLARSVAAA